MSKNGYSKKKLLEACDGDFSNGLYNPSNQIKVE